MARRRAEDQHTPELFDGMRADYAAAKRSKFRRFRTGNAPQGSHADYHYRGFNDFLVMMEQARDLIRNDSVIGQGIERAVTNTINNGITPSPKTSDEAVNAELHARFEDWSNDPEQCDVAGESTFWDFENFALTQTFGDGDMMFVPTTEGSLQAFEAHRIRTPKNTTKNVVHGVLLSETRKRLQYWVTKEDVSLDSSLKLVGDTVQYDVRDALGFRQVFHVYDPKRITQTRGVTALRPMMDIAGMFEDLNFAKLVQAQVVSCFAFFRKRTSEWNGGESAVTGETSTVSLGGGVSRTFQGLAPGAMYPLEQGEEIQPFSPNVPNAEYFPHVKLLLTLLGINIGMPLVLLLMDASETNFSGYRGAIDQARMGFRRNQRWLVKRFHQPVYETKVRQWMADDPALARFAKVNGLRAILKCRWNLPAWPYIEPSKDAATDLMRSRNGLTSDRRIHAERGTVYAEIVEEIVQDRGMAIRRAKQEAADINAQFNDGQPCNWRDIIPLPTPDGIQGSIDAVAAADAANAPQPATNGNNRIAAHLKGFAHAG